MSAEARVTPTGTTTPPPSAVERLRLVHVTSGDQKFTPVLLQPGINFVGRVPGNHLVLDSELVSRRHAKLIVTDVGVTLHDLDSHNGVFVNGKKVRTRTLLPGDLVYFADICCAVEADDDEKGEVVAAAVLDIEQASLQAGGLPDHARALLLDVTERLLHVTDTTCVAQCLQVCRQHLGADLGLFAATPLGETPPVVEGDALRAELLAAVQWPLVQGVLASRVVQFSDPESAQRLHRAESSQVATIAVPVTCKEELLGALYFSRGQGGRGFGPEDAEALGLVGQVLALRVAKTRGTSSASSASADESEEVTATTLDALVAGAGERELRAALDRAQNAIDEQQRESLQARKQLSTLRSEILSLRTELAEEQTQLAPLRQAVDEERQARDSVEQHLRAAQQDQIALRQENSSLQQALHEAQRLYAEEAALRSRAPDPGELNMVKLTQAVRQRLPSRWADGVEDALRGVTPAPLAREEHVLLCVSLHGHDAWCENQATAAADQRLEAFCNATHRLVEAYGGDVEQILGHTHLAYFAAGPAGALAAARCATALSRALGPELAVQAGIDAGAVIGGFSSRVTKVRFVAAGKPVAVARGAMEAAPPGGVMASEAVRDILPQGTGVLLVNHGPHIVRGIQLPVVLHAVQVDVT
ncbi:MAG: FHA domain-containing protein [Myxococcota bacterium]